VEIKRSDPAIVFGAYITGLAAIRAFGRAGVPVFVAGRDHTTLARSRWFRPAPGDPVDESTGVERLVAYLRSLPFERSVLFPCSDRWTTALASLPDECARAHTPIVASATVVRTLVDKLRFAHAARAHAVAAPRMYTPAEVASIGDDDLENFFIKPCHSQPFADRFGVKAFRIEGRGEAMERLASLRTAGFDVLLQEYIPGPPTAHLFLDGYVDRTGVMRACFARRRLRAYPREFGNSTLSVTIPLDEVAPAFEALCRLFEGLGYRGLFDAEFKHDARDGQFKILEVNPRPWWQLELAAAAGLDVCTMAYRDALGEPIATASSYRIGRTWVHPVQDLTAWWNDRHSRERAGGFPLRAWLSGPNTVFSWDDPAPAIDEVVRFSRVLTRRPRRQRRSQLRTPNAAMSRTANPMTIQASVMTRDRWSPDDAGREPATAGSGRGTAGGGKFNPR